MLSLAELNDLFDKLGTPSAGRKLILKARQEAPVRSVQSTGGNVVHFYPSRKMNKVIKTESGSPEFRANIHHEFDSDVLEYYAQPVEVEIPFHPDDPKRRCYSKVTPDFLAIRTMALVIEEWKIARSMPRLALKSPDRYRLEGGLWRSPDIEAYFLERGIIYQLRFDEDHPTIYIENLRFLAQYLDDACPRADEAIVSALRGLLLGRPVVPLWEMVEAAKQMGPSGTDDLYKAVADRQIITDWDNEALGDTLRTNVYRDEASLWLFRTQESDPPLEPLATEIQEGATVNFDGKSYTIQMASQHEVILKGDGTYPRMPISVLERLHLEGSITVRALPKKGLDLAERMNALPPSALRVAADRAQRVELAKTNPDQAGLKPRTLARYRKAMRDAGNVLLDQRFALAPRWSSCGSRDPKLLQAVQKAIEDTMKEFYNKESNPTKAAAYLYFKGKCMEINERACSLNTFLAKMRPLISDHKRLGKKGAYQRQQIVYYLHCETPIHGVRPWEFAHIDGTELELFARGPRSLRKLGKVWLTVVMDAESRAVLGFYISFAKAGYRSVMMAIRDMVRRHHRLPEILILDNGPEHKARALIRLCALYGITIRWRPKGQPRHGTVIERLFGITMTEFIHLLEGNTQLLRNPRSVSKAVQPEQFTRWTLVGLHKSLEWFFFQAYGGNHHPAHAGQDWETPMEHLEHRVEDTGTRRHALVRYDDQFLIETCPGPVRDDFRTVDQGRGITVDNYWYQSKVFKSSKLHGEKVEVRIDPWDDGYVYALVNNHWERCVSKAAMLHRNYTAIERRYASQWIRTKIKKNWRDDQEGLAAWRAAMDPVKQDPLLAEQESEVRRLYEPLGMGSVQSLAVERTDAIEPAQPTVFRRVRRVNAPSLTEGSTPLVPMQEANLNKTIAMEPPHVLPLL